MIGSSVSMVTGDYSRGASGFWIKNVNYQLYTEATIAGNLKDMFMTLKPATTLIFHSKLSNSINRGYDNCR